MATPPGSVKYYFGRITREEAEAFLHDGGLEDGLFLLRESMKKMGDYVLSVCFQTSVHHYSLVRQDDGQLQIENGKKFPGPIELIAYHQQHRDGLVTYPTKPYNRPNGKSYVVFRGVSSHELDRMLLEKAMELKTPNAKLEEVLASRRSMLINLVKMGLHNKQPWYHGAITREEAEVAMRVDGLEDGKYLLRAQADKNDKHTEPSEYRLTLCCHGEIKHYIVTFKNKKYFIETGPQFESLIELVDHYHNKADGLLCTLKTPCSCAHRYSLPVASPVTISPLYGTNDPPPPYVLESPRPVVSGSANQASASGYKTGVEPKSPSNHTVFPGRQLPPPPQAEEPDDEDDPADKSLSTSASAADPLLHQKAEENQKIYDSLPTKDVSMNLPRDTLDLKEELGSGCFGSVLKGFYKKDGREIPVAVKTLKGEDLVNGKEEIMKEARIMAQLMHKHIVRIIGVVQGETLMLVLELAALGPLHKFLKGQPGFPMVKIALLMYQVALGMEFLESRKFVHRDLAARNVLLASDTFAKISDFGLSKAIGIGNEYYKAAKPGKWPLKWYAPECMYYYKFTPKSDVWSYGVTMWEATSYGKKPYARQKPVDIVSSIENGDRLRKPSTCPDALYEIMRKCWEFDASDRPSFTEIARLMKPHTAGAKAK